MSTSRLSLLVFIAWRNLWRNRIRSALTISALTIGLGLMIVYVALIEGMTRQMVDFATKISTGHIQVHRTAYIENQDLYALMPWKLVAALDGVDGVNVAPRLYAAGLAAAGDESTGVMIKAVDPERERAVTSLLKHVRSGEVRLDPVQSDTSDFGLPQHHVVIGAQLAKNMGVSAGAELVLITQAADGSIGNAIYQVAGVLKPVEPGFDRMGILMSIKAFQELMYIENGVHELAITTDNIDLLAGYQANIESVVADFNISASATDYGGPVQVRNWRQLVPVVSDMLEMNESIIYFVGAFIVGLAALGMMNTVLMAVHERQHEFGILLSIGMNRFRLLFMVLLESFFLSLVSALLGAGLGVSVSRYLEVHGIDLSAWLPDGMDWGGIIFEPVWKSYLTIESVIVGILIMVTISMFASLIPSWRTVRMKPAEVMR
ncbi:MAG: ABC transporter permease [Proteobacteria bacterium]|nr:ABC transporter permease [Pseudomonadota bacterium]